MPKQTGDDVITVKLQPQDREALDWLKGYVQQQCGRGVYLSTSDVVRWLLHTSREGLGAGQQREEAET